MTTCRICGNEYTVEPDLEPSGFCNLCAQNIVCAVAPLVPQPPQAITYEQGCLILDAMQKALYPPDSYATRPVWDFFQ